MKPDHRRRLNGILYDLTTLAIELQDERGKAEGPTKTQIRAVLVRIGKAEHQLAAAVGRASR